MKRPAILQTLADLKTLYPNRANALWLLWDWRQHEDLAEPLLPALKANSITVRVGDPTRNIGAAVELMNEYGIHLEKGTCYGDVRAILEKEKWRWPIAPDADPWSYSLFTKQKREDVDCIQAISRHVEIAICQCVLSARRAGVI